ncbi:hypothetical protein JVU11DRAFT_10403 [Chiua virens]|nr:hypothetical protein JVU11DRAFT_10403 [Chiua virens]
MSTATYKQFGDANITIPDLLSILSMPSMKSVVKLTLTILLLFSRQQNPKGSMAFMNLFGGTGLHQTQLIS